MTTPSAPISPDPGTIAFIGGGNMAGAILGGLIRKGHAPAQIEVVEPFEAARDKLKQQYAVHAQAAPGVALDRCGLVVWAVKPQAFKEAALQTRFHTKRALHLSVAAGIRSDSIARWLDTERVVRAMPNTPALIGKGMTGLFARPAVDARDRELAQGVLDSTGDCVWVEEEELLDAVTALSGSGPAYVFYFLEAMINAGAEMGLTRDQASRLAVGTFVGAAELARGSREPPEILRQRVTSKGGTTHAAISSMDDDRVRTLFDRAIHAARRRAEELGDEFGH